MILFCDLKDGILLYIIYFCTSLSITNSSTIVTTPSPFLSSSNIYLDPCFNETQINYNESLISSSDPSVFTLIKKSKPCWQSYNSTLLLYGSNSESDLPLCPSGLLTVSLIPVEKFNHGKNQYPHVELSISVIAHSSVSSLYVHLQCIQAPDADDVYCHNSELMVVDGRWQWPCRAVTFDKEMEHVVQLPLRFGYKCFRQFGLSQNMVNVTVFPQNCRASLLVTSPLDTQLFPSLAAFYPKLNVSHPEWAPLLIVDLSDAHGVWLRVEGPAEHSARRIMISLYEVVPKGSLSLVENFEILQPATGVKWRNAHKGSFVVYAHVVRHDCWLICDEEKGPNCRTCVHTMMNFTLDDHRASIAYRSLRKLRDSSNGIIITLLGLVLVTIACGLTYLWWLRRRAAARTTRDVELVERQSVLLVYSDDCQEHSDVVAQFARLLETCSKASVMLDQDQLNVTGVRPSRWIVDSVCKASHVLLMVSPCTSHVLNVGQLPRRRPFPDSFSAAFDLIVRECTEKLDSRRFAVCRLPYSPTTPHQIEILGLRSFEIPDDCAQLTAFIHSLESGNPVQQNLEATVLEPFLKSIEQMQAMMTENVNWMEERKMSTDLAPEKPESAVVLMEPPTPADLRDRGEVAEEFGLLPPDTEAENEDSEFALLPPDSDSDG